MHLALFAAPDRDRRSPIAVARDRPIARIFEPFAKTAILDVLGHPMDLLIGGDQLIFDFFDGDKPGAHRFVDQRRIGAPAERVAVADLSMVEDLLFCFKPRMISLSASLTNRPS